MAFRNPAWTAARSTMQAKAPTVAQTVRDMTRDGRSIVERLVEILESDEVSARDRISAATVLLDRGFGKAVETSLTLTADASQSEALSQLADAELERLAATLGPGGVTLTLPAVPVRPSADLEDGGPAPEEPAALERQLDAFSRRSVAFPDAPPHLLEVPLPRRDGRSIDPSPLPQPFGGDIGDGLPPPRDPPAPRPLAQPPVPRAPRRRIVVPPRGPAGGSQGGSNGADGTEG